MQPPAVNSNKPRAKVTVISPARNATPFYPAWLRSIERQRYEQLEVILVDDGSDDYGSPNGLLSLSKTAPHFLRYIRLEGVGPAAARNAALRATKSEYVAFLDLDDLWNSGHLHRLVAVLENDPEVGIVQGQIRKFLTDEDGQAMYCSHPYNFVNLGSAVYRRQIFDQCGLFDEALMFGEDFDLIFRCWECGVRKVVLPEISLLYHRHDGNMTRGKNTVDLGAVRVYKRRIDRLRLGLIDPEVAEASGVTFIDYLGTTVGPFDEGVRELVEL